MSDSNLRVLVMEPLAPPCIKEIPNELKDMQAIVDGYIQTIPCENGLVMVVNEEGRLRMLPYNLKADLLTSYGPIVGTVFITKAEGEEFVSLTDEDVASALQNKLKDRCELSGHIHPVFNQIFNTTFRL